MTRIKETRLVLVATLAGFGLCVSACGDSGNNGSGADLSSAAPDMAAGGAMAVATINEPGGAQGTATFEQLATGVKVTVNLTAVPGDGMHGMHIHATGDCSDTATDAGTTHHGAAGSHFNPDNVNHGCPPATPHHAGDLANISISGGAGTATLTTSDVTVSAGPRSVVGKAFVLHMGADDCATQPTGNSGGRIGCAVITAK
jgi:Cu-Zn family superoxide dismutase